MVLGSTQRCMYAVHPAPQVQEWRQRAAAQQDSARSLHGSVLSLDQDAGAAEAEAMRLEEEAIGAEQAGRHEEVCAGLCGLMGGDRMGQPQSKRAQLLTLWLMHSVRPHTRTHTHTRAACRRLPG
jgi:hypothetical protein